MNRRVFAGLFLGVFAAAGLAAQTADELIEKNVQAHGGREKLKSVQSIRLSGKMVMGQGMEAPFTEEMARPNSVRRDFTIQGMTGTMVYDGKSGWQVMPFMGKKDPEAMSEDELKDIQDDADIDGPLIDYKAKGNQVEFLGKADIEGSPAYKLKLTQKSGNVSTIYLDADTYLEIKVEAKRSNRGQVQESETSIGNYKTVEGLMVPFTMETKVKGGQGGMTLNIEKVEVNPKLEADRFVMPKAAPAPAPAPKPN